MKLYKLTDEHGRTQNNTQWGEGVTHTADTALPAELCTEGVIHAYSHPVLAIIMNPIHAGFKAPRLWEAEGDVVIDEGLKVGCRSLTTVKEIELPELTPEQRKTFAIKCALAVYDEPSFVAWAANWLSGKDRTVEAARTAWAAWAAWATAEAADWAADWAAAGAAAGAAWVAWATARAAVNASEAAVDFVAIIESL